MAPNKSIQEALHTYRSLLRVASYLPTKETRAWVTNRITHRFRQKELMTHEYWLNAKQIRGQLDRATHGDIDALYKVFSYTYGRSGPRRRALLSTTISLHHKSDLANPPPRPPLLISREVKPRVARNSKDHNRGGGLNNPTKEPSPFFTAYQYFLKDQEVHRPRDLLGRNSIKFLDPPIPQLSVWLRPVAIKRERGIVKKWVEGSLDNVVPPLPAREWEFLKAVSTGERRPERPPQRRMRVGDWEEDGRSLLTLDNLKFSIRHSMRKVIERKDQEREWHEVTPQLLRRMHARIWYASCKMEWDGEGRKWAYEWGSKSEPKKWREKVVPRDGQLWKMMGRDETSKLKECGPAKESEKSEKSGRVDKRTQKVLRIGAKEEKEAEVKPVGTGPVKKKNGRAIERIMRFDL